LGLFAVGAPDWDATVGGYWLSYAYVNCTKTPSIALANGACPLPIPATLTPGLYELRLFAADGLWRLATSFSFNLIIPPASPNLPTGVVVK
jgi:hypothetical protein